MKVVIKCRTIAKKGRISEHKLIQNRRSKKSDVVNIRGGHMIRKIGFLMPTCAATAALIAGSAHAQSSGAEAQTAATHADALQTVTVTAQKRTENQQNVPIAVVAVGANKLVALGVNSILDLQVATPSLLVTDANGTYSATLRGVGDFAFAPGQEASVAVIIDGVYIAQPLSSELALNNIDHIEVLKGPQGTLFGRNTTGGVVSVITRTPTQQPAGNFSLDYGNYSTVTGNGYLSGPLTNDLAADVAVRVRTQGQPFGRNIFDGTGTGQTKLDLTLRSKWVWEPDSKTMITLIGNYWKADDTRGFVAGAPGTINGYVNKLVPPPGPNNPLGLGPFNFNYIDPNLGPDNVDQDTDYKRSGFLDGGSLKIAHDFGGVAMTSITAYRAGVFRLQEDIDFSPFPMAWLKNRQTQSQFSQEVTLNSTGSSKLKWTVGGYYFNMLNGYDPIFLDFSNYTLAGNIDITQTAYERAKSWAGYAQATYAIFDDTDLTVGARYTTEQREEYGNTFVFIPVANFTTPPTFYSTKAVNASKATYRVSLDHHFTRDIMGYVSFNTGFKSGGWNIGNLGGPDDKPYFPETMTTYEAGLKTEFFEHRLRLNVAGFYNDYKNLQVEEFNTTGTAVITINGPVATIYGMDADFEALLTKSFTVSGGVEWLRPTFGTFRGCPTATAGGGVHQFPGDCTGKTVPFAPDFTASLAGAYTTRLGPGILRATVAGYFNNGFYFQPDNVNKQGSYFKLNAEVRWTSDHRYFIGVFGDNLTNERNLLSNGFQDNNVSAAYADPVTYGVRVGYTF